MAAFAIAAMLNRRSAWVAAALLALPLAAGPLALRLEQASTRSPVDFSPAYAGKMVEVKGLVSSRPISFLDYQQLAIQEGGYGLVLEAPNGTFDKLNPGDEVDVVGKISARVGMVVLQPTDPPRVLFHGAVPVAEVVDRDKLRSTRYLG